MVLILQDPNIESPANIEAAKLFRESKKSYFKKVRYSLSS
jgi:ubiquitin-protein ligase